MPRSDSVLLTGSSSAVREKLERTQLKDRLRKENKEANKTKMMPVHELVTDLINKEREATILKMLDTVDIKTTDKDHKALLLSLRLYKESINSIQAKINAIMRMK